MPLRVLALHRPLLPQRGRSKLVTLFDLQLTDDITLRRLHLMRRPDGTHRTYAGNVDGVNAVSFAPRLADQITKAALAAYEGQNANDITHT